MNIPKDVRMWGAILVAGLVAAVVAWAAGTRGSAPTDQTNPLPQAILLSDDGQGTGAEGDEFVGTADDSGQGIEDPVEDQQGDDQGAQEEAGGADDQGDGATQGGTDGGDQRDDGSGGSGGSGDDDSQGDDQDDA